MEWLERVGHRARRRLRKVQGFFTFYGGKLRDSWMRGGQPWRRWLTRLAFGVVAIAFVATAVWTWSVWRGVTASGPGDGSSAASSRGIEQSGSQSVPVAAPEPIKVSVHPVSPPKPERVKPAVGVESLVRPVSATATVPPGWRRDPVSGHWYYEFAVGFHAPPGSPVEAALPGVVTEIRTVGSGMRVMLDHGSGLRTVYTNVHDVDVAVGDSVSTYTRLGRLTEVVSDRSTSDPSIMFTVYDDDDPLDVVALFK